MTTKIPQHHSRTFGYWLILMQLTVCLIGCAQGSRNQTARKEPNRLDPHAEANPFQVTVKSDGKEVKDSNASLIHRVTLSPTELATVGRLTKPESGTIRLKRESDNRGGTIGLRIQLASPEQAKLLGLQNNDIVTAVGKTGATKLRSLEPLVQGLQAKKSETLTLIRGGKPHKILYYLGS
jgi:hypothetical protein